MKYLKKKNLQINNFFWKALFIIFFIYIQESYSQTKKIKILVNDFPCVQCSCELIQNNKTIKHLRTNTEGFILLSDTLNIETNLKVDLGEHLCLIPKILEKRNIVECLDFISKKMNSVELDEVVVFAKNNIIENNGNMLIYNVDKDLIKNNVNGVDVLRKTPLVSVDINGSPSIKGDKNVLILVNGKEIKGLLPSQILNQISAQEISKIEVITSPSAKYDSNGIGGILNIITRKKINFKSSGTFAIILSSRYFGQSLFFKL